MNDGHLEFTFVPHQYGELSHHFEKGPLMVNLIFYSVMIPFVGTDEELGCTREVVEISNLSL